MNGEEDVGIDIIGATAVDKNTTLQPERLALCVAAS